MQKIDTYWKYSRLFWSFVVVFFLTIGCADLHAESSEPMVLKGSFSLLDENGDRKTLADYRGSYPLIFFGYTYCPDVCPTNLGIMSEALEMLPAAIVAKLQPLFISVDPERDSLEHLKDFTEVFHPALVGLTGTLEEVAAAARTFGVYYAKAEEDPEDPEVYMVDHSANTFLLDEQGRLLAIFDHATPPKQVVKGILQHLQR